MNFCRNKQPAGKQVKSSDSKAIELPNYKRQTLEPKAVPKVERVRMFFCNTYTPEPTKPSDSYCE